MLGSIKNINYETKNIDNYKDRTTNELFGAFGLASEINLQRNTDSSTHFLTPKILLRLAPGSMRKEENGSRLDPTRAFSLNRLDSINNFESKKVKIQVYKPGLSSFIFKFAHNFSFMYGLFSAIIAVSLGLSAGLIFRKYL